MEKLKKILILGGSYSQLPFIIKAKERGFYTILVDFLEDNPGQEYADKYYNLSTTDKEAVLELALKVKPDIVFSYASDPAAPTVAYVAHKLGLNHANKMNSVNILGEKNRFRKFLKSNGFNVPDYRIINLKNFNKTEIERFSLPFIIKPTDSSGSKGVSLVRDSKDIQQAIEKAANFSRNKILIAEEYIDTGWKQIHGDIFVENGEIIFSHLGDHHFDVDQGSFVPYATSWPSKYPVMILNSACEEITKVINLLGFRNGPINVEARIKDGDVYLMELGPRNGGNFVPQITELSTGFDMLAALFNQFANISNSSKYVEKKYSCYYILRSFQEGILNNIIVSSTIEKNIVERYIYKDFGESVNRFSGSDKAIGIYLMIFEDRDELESFLKNAEDLIKIKIG